MKVHLELRTEKQLTWHALSAGWWTGHVYDHDHWLSAEEVDAALKAINSIEDLKQLLHRWNGHFALMWSDKGLHFAATDIGRSIPVFWQINDGTVSLSNRPVSAEPQASIWHTQTTFAQSEFVPGHATLWQGWQQLQAGEILEIKGGLCYLHNYFPHRRSPETGRSESQMAEAFQDVLHGVFDRFISFADGRPIVIPLSGGYDSRILLAGLHERGYTNVQAFTYGQEGSTEARIAREVAQQLEVDWQFVPYDKEILSEFGTPNWNAFAAYAVKGCALPQEQDYFALSKLKKAGWLKPGSIISPGYCGDFQAGSYIPEPQLPWPPNRKRRLQNQLTSRFLRYPNEQIKRMWLPLLPQEEIADQEQYISELEHWVLREYVSKYILNGVRAYEWFECSWHLPLWDREFILFWQKVPNRHRKEMQLYRQVLAENWFKPHNIVFPEDKLQPAARYSPGSWLPPQWKKRIKAYLPNKQTSNINGLQQLIPIIQQQLAWTESDLSKSVNEMIGHWYHDFINNQGV